MYGDRETFIFPVQLTTRRIGNFSRLMHTRLYVMTMMLYLSSQQLCRVVLTPMRLPVPPDCIKDLNKRSKMAKKGILPPPLNLFRKLAICCQFNSSSSRQFRHRYTSHHARHRFRALILTHWGTTRSRFILLKRWQMARKQREGKFRWQHGPMTWRGNIKKRSEGKCRFYRSCEGK